MAGYETPQYVVLSSSDNIEMREYPSYYVAAVTSKGSRSSAANESFSILFNYINGKNIPNEKISMTIPVEQVGEKISMTVPVELSGEKVNLWTLSFILPSKYNLDNIPKPVDERIKIYKKEGTKRIVIVFSGFSSDSNFMRHKKELNKYIEEKGIKVKEGPIYAFYNSPFTLPFLRRNEIMYVIE